MSEDKNVFKFPTIMPKTDNEIVREALSSSVEQFKVMLEGGVKGFATIVIDDEGTPSFILSGDIDPLQMLGALDVFKLNISAQLVQLVDPTEGY